LLANEVDAAEKAISAVRNDLRFEHLDHADDAVWRFVAECWADRSADYVPVFVERHAAVVRQATCYLPVEFLTVNTEAQFPELVLLPVTDPRVPPATPLFALEQPTGCVAAVEVEGTDYGRMADRAGNGLAGCCGPCGSLSAAGFMIASYGSVSASGTHSTRGSPAGIGVTTRRTA
jgi:hypothetical protein